MVLKTKVSTTSSQRHLIKINSENLQKKPTIKSKLEGRTNFAGRNNSGKITVRHKGGGHKKRYRKIDFSRVKESASIVLSIEYDPYRNAFISALYDFLNKKFLYIIATKNLKLGDIVKSGLKAEPKLAHSLALSEIPLGSCVNNISSRPFGKAQFSRSAGTFSYLKEKTFKYAKLELNSGEQKFVPINCFATIGIVSNNFVSLTQLGKAGRSRWLNRRPTVRGVAMNPVDHPHGGGEGKKSGSGKTPWGKNVKMGRINNLKKRNE